MKLFRSTVLIMASLGIAACGSTSETSTTSTTSIISAPLVTEAEPASTVASSSQISTFTAEVWADNWFALYVNGELVSEDSVPIGEIIATTNGDWRGLVIQTAPLNVECEKSADPDTDCQFEALDEPANWTSSNFDDSSWVNATSYLGDEVGVKDGYNEITWDSMAEIIWGPNLNTNNTILWRTQIQ